MDPVEHEKYCKNMGKPCIMNCNEACNHPVYHTVKKMAETEWTTYKDVPYNNSLEEYMREHMEWLVHEEGHTGSFFMMEKHVGLTVKVLQDHERGV